MNYSRLVLIRCATGCAFRGMCNSFFPKNVLFYAVCTLVIDRTRLVINASHLCDLISVLYRGLHRNCLTDEVIYISYNEVRPSRFFTSRREIFQFLFPYILIFGKYIDFRLQIDRFTVITCNSIQINCKL